MKEALMDCNAMQFLQDYTAVNFQDSVKALAV